MAQIGSHIEMLRHQGVALFESLRRIRGCGFFKGSVSLEVAFKVSKAHMRF